MRVYIEFVSCCQYCPFGGFDRYCKAKSYEGREIPYKLFRERVIPKWCPLPKEYELDEEIKEKVSKLRR